MIEFKVGRLAEAIGVHRNTVRNWIKSGVLNARSTIGKKYIINSHELHQFLDFQGVPEESIESIVSEMKAGKNSVRVPETEKPIIRNEVPMVSKPVGSVLVVGGGIAGIQASLDLADSGYYVYLLEKGPGIGGGMARLDKTFPTNDCAM